MNKKSARIIAVLAFIALLRPCANALTFAEGVWYRLSNGDGGSPYYRLLWAINEAVGADVACWANIAFMWILTAIPAILIYRYLAWRDFKQVCDACAAHRVLAWTLFALFAVFSITSFSRIFVPATLEDEPIPLDEAMEQNGPVSLAFCLCHPDTDKRVKELCDDSELTEESLAAAPKIEGYRLLPIMDGNRIFDACYVSDTVELSESDVTEASAYKSYTNDNRFEVSGKLNAEGTRKMRTLTRDHMPHGAKNPGNTGRRLAIIVNGRLVSAPIIQSEIAGSFVITGRLSKEEAVSLAAALNSRQTPSAEQGRKDTTK